MYTVISENMDLQILHSTIMELIAAGRSGRPLFLVVLFLCGLTLSQSRPVIGQTPSRAIEIPFKFEKGYVIVDGTIKGSTPVELILSTGSEHSFLLADSIEKYKLKFEYTSDDPKHCATPDCTFAYADVPDIHMGGVETTAIKFRLVDNYAQQVEKRLGRSVFGMVGTDFFKGRVVRFDFSRKLVTFLADAAPSESGAITLKMLSYDDYLTMPVSEECSFDGKKIRMLFDTGLPQVIALSPQSAKELGQAVPDKQQLRPGTIQSLLLGDYELKAVPVWFSGKETIFDRREFGATAGVGLLQNFISTFDFRKKTISFKPL